MPAFLKRHRILIISALLLLFSLHLSLTDKKGTSRGFLLKDAAFVVLSPLQGAVIGAYNSVTGVAGDYVLLVSVNRDNDTLKNTVTALQEENNRLKEEVRLNARLRDVLEYKEAAPFYTAAAGIVSLNIDQWSQTVTINKGSAAGIAKDMAVISPLGAVGRIVDTAEETSTVLLSTDIRSNIDVIIQRTRIKGVVEGNGAGGHTLKYVRQLDDAQVGDELIASGLSGIFPKGLPVGEIVRTDKGKDNFFKYIEVRPAVDIQRLEEVLVVTSGGDFD